MALPHKVVVYINGYRFDPLNVSVTFTAQEICTFQVDVTPVPEWDMLLPRSHGAVFFLDPLVGYYRLMCEGDYIGLSRSKTGTGQRTRSLLFRGLHGSFDDTSFVNMVGVIATAANSDKPSIAIAAMSARASGSIITADDGAGTFKTVGLETIINKAIAKGGDITSAMLEIPKQLLAQTPVESYYFWARRADRKMHTFEDSGLKAAMDIRRWSDFQKNALNTMGLGPSATLMSVIQKYEEMAFYQHVSIPAPPLYRMTKADTSYKAYTPGEGLAYKIPELFLCPYMYNTIPPACNVVFNDQLKHVSGTLAYAAVPTRLIAQLAPAGVIETAMPLLYMANNQFDVLNASLDAAKLTATQQVTHGMFSEEELLRGVTTVFDTFRYEKIQPSGESILPLDTLLTRATVPKTLELMVLHDYNKIRGQNRVVQIIAVFQPYLVPGFPCVIEDGNQPFRGMLQSVTHNMTPDGQPSTSLTVTHVEELIQIGTRSKTAPLPAYLNPLYTPLNIAETYKGLFGTNLMSTQRYATCVPPNLITQAMNSDDYDTGVHITGYTTEDGQLNLDLLLSAVVAVPLYDEAGNSRGFVSNAGEPIASQLRRSSGPHEAFLRYQHRTGCGLRDWMIMHNLQTAGKNTPSEGVDWNPPLRIGSRIQVEGDDVFGSPSWLRPNLDPSKDISTYAFEFPQYGAYEAVAKPIAITLGPQAIISPVRQTKTAAIQAAILRGATNDCKLSSGGGTLPRPPPAPIGDFNAPSANVASQA